MERVVPDGVLASMAAGMVIGKSPMGLLAAVVSARDPDARAIATRLLAPARWNKDGLVFMVWLKARNKRTGYWDGTGGISGGWEVTTCQDRLGKN
jgi:hypothetical protein